MENIEKMLKQILENQDKMQSQITQNQNKMQDDITNIKQDIEAIKTQQDENTQILRSLEHKSDVNKAEHDKMAYDLVEIKGNIKEMRQDLTNVELITSKNWNDIVKLKFAK